MNEQLSLLHTRNSAPKLTEPGPTPTQLQAIFQAALRAPDHAWLRPWRFITIAGERRKAFGEVLEQSLLARQPDADAAAREKARNAPLRAPLLVAVVVLVTRMLPETRREASQLTSFQVVAAYRGLCRNPRFMGYTLVCAAGLGMIFAFVTAAPFIIISDFGVPTERYGIFHGTIVVAYFLGSMVATRIAGRVSARVMLRGGLLAEAAGVLVLAILLLTENLTPWSLTAAMSIASLRATTEHEAEHSGRMLPMVRGILEDTGKAAAMYPGRLPDDPAELRDTAQQLVSLVKSQALRIAKLEHQPNGRKSADPGLSLESTHHSRVRFLLAQLQ